MMDLEIEKIADMIADRLRRMPDVIPGPDFTPKDLAQMTGMSQCQVYTLNIAGRYRVGRKILFRREEIMYRRAMGLNLETKKFTSDI